MLTNPSNSRSRRFKNRWRVLQAPNSSLVILLFMIHGHLTLLPHHNHRTSGLFNLYFRFQTLAQYPGSGPKLSRVDCEEKGASQSQSGSSTPWKQPLVRLGPLTQHRSPPNPQYPARAYRTPDAGNTLMSISNIKNGNIV